MTKSRNIHAPRTRWTPSEEYVLRDLYPDLPCADIAALLDRKPGSVYQAALMIASGAPQAASMLAAMAPVDAGAWRHAAAEGRAELAAWQRQPPPDYLWGPRSKIVVKAELHALPPAATGDGGRNDGAAVLALLRRLSDLLAAVRPDSFVDQELRLLAQAHAASAVTNHAPPSPLRQRM